MQRKLLAITITSAMLAASSAYASQGRGGGPKPRPVTPASAHAPKTHATTQGPKVQAPKPHVTTQAAKPTKVHGGPSSAAKSKPATTTTTTTTAATSKTSTATTTTATADAATLTPVQQKLQKNTNLASKLTSRLPAGTNLMTAAEGFRNLGQFVAAVNVSNNLDIPFTQLKMQMVEEKLSLGQAIKELRPTADATTAARTAETEADAIIRTTDATTSTTTTTATTTTGKTKHQKPVKTKKRG